MTHTQAYLLSPRVSSRFSKAKVSRLYAELGFALSRLERDALKGWGARSAGRLLVLAGRRVGGLAKLATLLARSGGGELLGLLAAYRQRRLPAHISDRTAAAIDGTISLGREGVRLVAAVARALIRDPKAAAPAVLGGLLGFTAGSGGVDANGGIPDMDLLGGIGAHRSPITHTLVAGILAEGLLLALADLAAEVHGKLPLGHDPIWDGLGRIGRPLTKSLAIGTSAGLAYHLLVDALVQPAAYHGLPAGMPLDGHQAVMAASGLAEGADAASRCKQRDRLDMVQGGLPEKTTGRIVVEAVSEAGRAFGRTANLLRTGYDLAFINTDADLGKLIASLKQRPRGSFCLYGPAGTGKSELARHIADELGRPALLRRASDLLSMWVGQSEKNIAAMFAEARQQDAVLVLDEADSFLADRRGARASWEVTQVNELLTQMEAFEGIFICTTNLMQKLDQASLRRFAFKLKFDYLRPDQRWAMFSQELLRLGGDPAEGRDWEVAVRRLVSLTPGDFAVAARQLELWGTAATAGELYEQLRRECAAKEGQPRAIGFTA